MKQINTIKHMIQYTSLSCSIPVAIGVLCSSANEAKWIIWIFKFSIFASNSLKVDNRQYSIHKTQYNTTGVYFYTLKNEILIHNSTLREQTRLLQPNKLPFRIIRLWWTSQFIFVVIELVCFMKPKWSCDNCIYL